MLVFLRQKAPIIASVIVGAMVLTLFAGAFYLGKNKSTRQLNPTDSVAMVGSTPIPMAKYNEILNQYAQRYRISASQKQDPEFVELLQYTSFEQSLQYTILLNAAKAAGVNPSGRDMDAAIQGVLVQYDLKDESQLKKMLKEAKYPWGQFKDNLEDDVRVRIFSNYLQTSIKVTNQDVDNHYAKINAQHILIRVTPGDKSDEERGKKKADGLYLQLKSGADFDALAKAHSDDDQTKLKGGHLDWIPFGTTVPEFETALYALDSGEISKPVRTPFGWHIIKVLDRKVENRPVSINYEAEKTQLLQFRQAHAVENYIRGAVSQSKIDVRDPYVRAYFAKVSGDTEGALGAYRTQSSLNTYDPRPHYLAAKLYKTIGDQVNELAELQKAVLKGSLATELDVPLAHLELGRIWSSHGNVTSRNAEYDKAIESAKGHLIVMKTLEKAFKDNGDYGRSSQVANERLRIEGMIKQTTVTSNAPAGAGIKL